MHFYDTIIDEMPISILDLSRKPSGSTQTVICDFSSLEDIELSKPTNIKVEITQIRHDLFGAHVTGEVNILLTCDKCLKSFKHKLKVDFIVTFSDEPDEEEWPIENNHIDLNEPLRQEILFSLSPTLICGSKCIGIQTNS